MMHNFFKKNTLQKRLVCSKTQYVSGFTLIEMLVAVLIFSLALVALMTISSRGIVSNRASANELTAQYLASEGVEIVRQIRDSNFISGQSWLSNGLDDCFGDGCYVEISAASPYFFLSSCGSNPCNNPMRFDAGNVIYGARVSGDPTPFIRTIYLEEIMADEEVRAVSQVTWQEGRIERSIQMTEHLFKWQNEL